MQVMPPRTKSTTIPIIPPADEMYRFTVEAFERRNPATTADLKRPPGPVGDARAALDDDQGSWWCGVNGINVDVCSLIRPRLGFYTVGKCKWRSLLGDRLHVLNPAILG